MSGLGVKGFITWLYYKDLERAMKFYERILGLEMTIDQGWAKIYRVKDEAYIGLVDELHGFHRSNIIKPVIVCLNVYDCDEWYRRIKGKGIDTLGKPQISDRLRIKAFMFKDPEGYVIEIQESLEGALSI